MNTDPPHSGRKPYPRLGALPLLLLAILAGCVGAIQEQAQTSSSEFSDSVRDLNQPPTIGPRLAPAPAPRYQPGTTYVFSDQKWQTVVRANADRVNWMDQLGTRSEVLADIVHRASEWKSKTRSGYREFTPFTGLFSSKPESLWPLEHGKSIQFREKGSWSENDKPSATNHYSNTWLCSVDGTETVSVLAGSFDTWRIKCLRYSGASVSGGDEPLRETILYFYAPEANHAVLEVRTPTAKGKEVVRTELLAMLPPEHSMPDAVRTQRSQAFQQAMEQGRSGATRGWSLSSAGVSGSIKPKGTFRLASGTFCRNYDEILVASGQTRAYFGMACRTDKASWEVPMR